MDLPEIDPELFASCRLCIDEKGLYQIIPAVMEQIKYCFDITVEQYDGLSQLLCKQCKFILNEYYDIKKKFKTKQEILLETKSHRVSSNTSTAFEKEVDHKDEKQDSDTETRSSTESRKKKRKKRIIPITSSSSSSADEFEPIVSNHTESDTVTYNKDAITSFFNTPTRFLDAPTSFLDTQYQKRFVCRYCNLECESIKNIEIHILSHNKLLQQRKIITRHCKVTMITFDELPNFTKHINIVALNKDKFVDNGNNLDYYIIYTTKYKNSNSDNETTTSRIVPSSRKHKKSEIVSSDEEDLRKFTSKKRIRLISTSPSRDSPTGDHEKFNNDMSLGNNANIVHEPDTTKTENLKCTIIDVDDTSTDTSNKPAAPIVELGATAIKGTNNLAKNKVKIKMKSSDYKTISNIISISFNKFAKKNTVQSSSKDAQSVKIKSNTQSDNFLNHKLLSIGRKVMSKSGFPSLSLLRYLQKRNLKVVWLSNNKLNPKTTTEKESEYVRVQTKIEEKSEDNLSGFQVCNIFNNDFDNVKNNLDVTVLGPLATINLDSSSATAPKIIPAIVPTVTCRNDPVLGPILEADAQTINVNSQLQDKPPIAPLQTINKLDSNGVQDNPLLLQLLNANPVANPKQVPKKKNPLEMINKLGVRSGSTASETAQISKTNDQDVCIYIVSDDDEQNTDSNMKMPIITSIKSLMEDVQTKEQVESSTISKTMTVTFEPVENTAEITTVTGTEPRIGTTEKEEESKNVTSTIVSDLQSNMPRIKCKPVSELLAPTVINTTFDDSQVPQGQDPVKEQSSENAALPPWALPTDSIVSLPMYTMADGNNTVTGIPLSSNNISISTSNTEQLTKKVLVVLMNSFTLPNTMTPSPFAYVKRVMEINSIEFMEINSKLSADFVCLIKFRLNVKQDKRAVLLYLSLHIFNNAFCMKLRDKKNEYIRIETKPVFWEWEVLKAFQDNIVASKTLERAKSISDDVHAVTQKFLTILKTVECKSRLEPYVT